MGRISGSWMSMQSTGASYCDLIHYPSSPATSIGAKVVALGSNVMSVCSVAI